MAERLLRYYKYVGEEMGMPGKIKLAMETKMPSTKAAIEPDNDKNLVAFREAVAKLTGKIAPNY